MGAEEADTTKLLLTEALPSQAPEADLVRKITSLYNSISKLPDLRPSPAADALFTELVEACIPMSPIDVRRDLDPEAQEMRSRLIRLCADAEGLLEAHYSDLLASYDDPLEHLELFPYYSNYLKLSKLEYDLLVEHVAGVAAAAERVAFVGSGPLPLSTLVLAARHMPGARFHNYDLSASANERARGLLRAGGDLGARMAFHTADVARVTHELAGYDVVFLAALVGMAAEEKARVIGHLGKYMAPGAALVVRSAHGARGFLYPIVEPEELGKGGFEVLVVHHPENEVINSVIVARKVVHAHGHGAVVSRAPSCQCCDMQARAQQKMEEMPMECCLLEESN